MHDIKLGNTLSSDQLAHETFDYMLSNPLGRWKKIARHEHQQKGTNGRFGAGLPKCLWLVVFNALISKMQAPSANLQHGSRIGIILNGSPLFTGGAGSGESEIRRFILERDLLEPLSPAHRYFITLTLHLHLDFYPTNKVHAKAKYS